MKVSNLFVRPNRHRNEKRVKGHVFMCMLAYRIVWEARKRLHPVPDREPNTRKCEGNSLREIWRNPDQISIGKLSIAGHIMKQFSTINKHQRKILNLLKVQNRKRSKIIVVVKKNGRRNCNPLIICVLYIPNSKLPFQPNYN